MAMVNPCPRYSSFPGCPPPPPGQTVDYSIKSPIGLVDQAQQPMCKYSTPYPKPVATYQAGSAISVDFTPGGATHGGGHCQFSLSYDGGQTFVVLQTILDKCFSSGLHYDVPIPKDAPPSDKVVFAWTWVNAIGNREFYMNCADIAVEGGNPSGQITGPKMTVANYGPSTPAISEFFFGGESGAQFYKDSPIISVKLGGSQSTGKADENAKPSSSDSGGKLATVGLALRSVSPSPIDNQVLGNTGPRAANPLQRRLPSYLTSA
ncbi:hypothetical protein IWQ62_003540 [Dispira parvispora]|uniref:Endoglucanase n=1 Tax=Dispira parvispora TaxID=1520584 RepID=A0A9W8E6Z1_9FUNG|nr:hypothetical protein IWQ62_003540 [Dispira parvispora]